MRVAHWLDKVVEILEAETSDLRELARIAGYNPATFYRGTVMDGVDIRGQDLTGMEFTHFDLSKVLYNKDTRLPILPSSDLDKGRGTIRSSNALTSDWQARMDELGFNSKPLKDLQLLEDPTELAEPDPIMGGLAVEFGDHAEAPPGATLFAASLEPVELVRPQTDPPSDFDLDKVHKMILSHQAPPPEWQPWINKLDF